MNLESMIRRVWVGIQRNDAIPVADCEGVAGEEFESEIYSAYGLAANIEGDGILLPINGNATNYQVLTPRGSRLADANTVIIYYGDETDIVLSQGKIEIKVGGNFMRIENGKINTDMDFITTGDVKASGVSLKNHKHISVQPGSGISGMPQ